MFEFYVGTKVYFGRGCRSQVEAVLTENKWSDVAVVIDHNLMNVDCAKKLIEAVKKACDSVILEQCRIAEPTYEYLEEIRSGFEGRNIQAVIGIGGGSAMDTAKAMAVLINNRRPAIEYRGFNKMTEPALPVIAVPTTAGTGSEVTPNASFIAMNEKKKMGINGEAVRPRYAVLDPEMTVSCPLAPTISAGIDSLVHAVEAYAAKKSNPMAGMFAKEGFRNVYQHLPLVVREPLNIDHREKVMYGAFLAGVALMHSGTGPAAAMSYPLGVHFRVPHGTGGGIFLPHVVGHNVRQGCYLYAGLYDGISDGGGRGLSEETRAFGFAEKISSLWRELSVPDDLARFGVTADFIPTFVQETMDLKGALDQNPVPFYENEIEKTLNSLGLK